MGFSLGLFNSKEEKNTFTNLFKNHYPQVYIYSFKEASLEDEEETFIYLYDKVKIENDFLIILIGSTFPEKIEYLIKQIKNKNISIIYSVNMLHKGLIKETDIKVYKKTLSPSTIDFIARRSGINYYDVKELKDNECIIEEKNDFKIIELKKMKNNLFF